jgi:putative Mg2+ transporter-C (MgtC) family protein
MSAAELSEAWSFLTRIAVSAALGGLLGLERDIHGRGAGLRTHLLVSVGAAVFMILSIRVESFGVGFDPGFMRVTDPGRIAAQIVTGIGFLGAGVIIKVGLSVRGLTTAACLWVAAAIGMATGAGFFLVAAVTTATAILALTLLRRLEDVYRKDVYRELVLALPNETELHRVLAVVRGCDLQIMFFGVERDYGSGTTVVRLSLGIFHKGNIEDLTERIIAGLERSGLPLKRLVWRVP